MDAAGPTQRLAAFTLSDSARLPAPVLAQAQRAFLNYLGCALGGVADPACALAFAQADEFSGARRATVIGRPARLDAPQAALVNCLQSSIQTFDDTHLPSVIHPTGPVAAAAMALLEHRPALAVDGREFLAALAFGVELSCRAAGAMTAPSAGMHLGVFTTGITGGLGAAAACGRLLGLDAQRQAWAIGIAAAQAGGLRVSHATMTGGLVPGLSARAGLQAALLAEAGFDCSDAALEGRNGLLQVFAPGAQAQEMVEGLGDRFEIAGLAYKPYPCGIVIHPAIDACLDLAAQAGGESIASVALRVHPLALQLTGVRHPTHAFGCNVSVFHWAAAALVRGRAGLAEASESALHDPAIAALREAMVVEPDATCARDEAGAEVTLAGGRVLTAHVAHARGSRERPLTDAELHAKFLALAAPALGGARAHELLDLCGTLPHMDSSCIATLAARCIPH